MNRQLVTVVMPAYNAALHIEEAIRSALQQVDCDVEVMVVDDGSTDNTASITQSFDDRVRYVSQSNAGPAAARNLGVSLASHDWIAFLDADDVWEPTKLSCQLQLAQKSNSPFVYTDARNFGDDHVSELRSSVGGMPRGDVLEALLLDNFITLSSVLLRRELFQFVGGFRTEYCGTEDWDLWLRIAAARINFEVVPEPLTRYRWQDGSLSKAHLTMARQRWKTLDEAISLKKNHSISWSVARRARAKVMATSAWFAEDAHPGHALYWYCQSLFYWPFCKTTWKALIKIALKAMTRRWNTVASGDPVNTDSELADTSTAMRIPRQLT
ncbi:glycosyltransferase family 2 protein [Fuerstiella marisgermanici]|uniref:Chondroitin polymerase n=1 Tax=Fuerstiella marisgermanici TaxID=1891926 RepID=A0A1P8WQR3_9PLAN|nr:glycosyltransferase family 2 protein [Fuerstiella marisgermanici]APZ96397.1 Chondroitin polymerase [Fuerstiella marisgermanici]